MTGGLPGTGAGPGYTPGQLARLLSLPEPTTEQSAVISAPLEPMAVIAGAGSGKSETMAARLIWLTANGLVRPERVLGLTFTRKAAAELGQRVRSRLAGLRQAGFDVTLPGGSAEPGETGGLPPVPGPVRPGPAPASGLPRPGPLPPDPLFGEPVVSTYHSYAARLVADHALREALEPSLRLVTAAVAWQIAARVVAAYSGPMDAVTWAPQTVTAAVLALAGELAEHLRTPGDVRQAGAWLTAASSRLTGSLPSQVRRILACQRAREQLLPLVGAYAEAKAAREMIDYGDQVALAARIAARHPEVGAAERARYQVVLLDEYQDTSHAQLLLLRSLFGGGHPVTAVGDPCQSIYGWRGASAANLRRFTTDFPLPVGSAGNGQRRRPGPPRPAPRPAAEERPAGTQRPAAPDRAGQRPSPLEVLSVSFRNTGRVLDAAAAIQADLRAEAPDVPRLVPPADRADRGEVACALLETVADEARWVAERVEGLLSLPPGTAPDGRAWPGGGSATVRPAGIAVLCRKRAQFPALRSAIEERGIPVEVVGLGGLLTVPEVADIVATLRVLHDPTASGPLVRLLTGPRWRIGPRDLVALGSRARVLAREHAGPGRDRAGHPAPGQAGPPDASGGESAAVGGGSRPPAGDSPGAPVDPLDQVVSDLIAEPGSLVEALDDLGDPAQYSAAGHARFAALAGELRALRMHAGRHLPDLVGEVERVLGLDVEVAAQPWRDPAAARADLDAFADDAAAFADDEEEPTLGAFLAYLTAAEAEEFGLESGQPSGADAVTLTTVHAAKGLQWSAVIVPGLSAGPKSQVFPARPRVTTRWTENPRLLPFSLRGDSASLPALPDLAAESLASFTEACTARELAEERRLAYVAVTRAAFWVACSGYWWGEGTSRLGPSVFLTEVRDACEAGAGLVAHWAPEPPDDAENPALAEAPAAAWPAAPASSRLAAIREAAAMVEQAMAEPAGTQPAGTPAAGGSPGPGTGAGPALGGDGMAGADLALASAWARDTDLLLAERQERYGDSAHAVQLPARLTVSSLVAMAADPAALARQIRRPMPRPPAPQARRGTAFHRWLEERFRQQRLLDPSDLLGAADEPAEDADAADLAVLREQFEAGEWADRWPQDVEVPFETLIAGRPVRGRIDAVFADAPGGGYDVVDWKTGDPPAAAEEESAAAVQLAAYRSAWAGLARVPVAQVRAAFYYIRHDLTLRPADLLDEAGLAALINGVPLARTPR